MSKPERNEKGATDDERGRLRREIDELDGQIVQLVNARLSCALKIGLLKKEAGQPVYDPQREKQVISHVMEVNSGPLNNEAAARIFERIIDETRHAERVASNETSANNEESNSA